MAARILACVEAIPPGRVMSYGDVAEYAGANSARTVGRVLIAAAVTAAPKQLRQNAIASAGAASAAIIGPDVDTARQATISTPRSATAMPPHAPRGTADATTAPRLPLTE
jgi:alkylated DNA nucleotide flippase Atl1